MKQRMITGAMIIAALVLVLFARTLTTYVFDAFIVMIAIIGAYEMSKLLAKMGYYNNQYVAMAYPVLAYAVFILGINLEMKWYMLLLIELAVLILLVGAVAIFGTVFSSNTKNEIKTRNLKIKSDTFSIYKALHTLFACVYPSVLLLLFVVINNLETMDYLINIPLQNIGYIATFALILTFIIPIFVDTFAYLTGSLFKGKKLCPSISPNKTISGAIGGVIWGVIASVAMFLIFNSIPEFGEVFISLNLQFWHFIILGLLTSIFCQIGDLFESKLKRKADVKDSGNILPGHGGILDRMDSHFFCVPFVLVFILIIL